MKNNIPDQVPNPGDRNVSTGNTSDLRESPISVSGDDGRNELSEEEGSDQDSRRTFSEEPSVRTSDEDLKNIHTSASDSFKPARRVVTLTSACEIWATWR